jgi:hypothetical protein
MAYVIRDSIRRLAAGYSNTLGAPVWVWVRSEAKRFPTREAAARFAERYLPGYDIVIDVISA